MFSAATKASARCCPKECGFCAATVAGQRHDIGRETRQSFTASVDADLILAHATSPFIRATVAGALEKGPLGQMRLGIQRRKVQTFAWFEASRSITASTTSPQTSHRAGLRRDQRFLHFSRELWCGRGRRIGDKPYMAVVDHIEGLDIDYPEFHDGRDHRGQQELSK